MIDGVIEGGVILLVFAVSVLIYLGARVGAERARLNPREEMIHLQERLAWHEGQLQLAREKHWDDVMVGHIRDQVADTQHRLAQVQVGLSGGE
jgi:hypothetical protein